MDNNFEENGSSAFGEEDLSEQRTVNSTPFPPNGQEQPLPQNNGDTEPQDAASPQTVSWQQISGTPYPQGQPPYQPNEQGYTYPDVTDGTFRGTSSQDAVPDGQTFGANDRNDVPNSQPYGTDSQNGVPNGQTFGMDGQSGMPNSRSFGMNGQGGIPNGQPYGMNGMPNDQPRYDMPQGGYVPPGMPANIPNMPNSRGMYPPPTEKKKRSFKGGCFWTLVVSIFAAFVVILLLAAAISMKSSKPNSITDDILKNDDVYTQKAQEQHVDIKLPKSERPVLEEEMYQNAETGLLTTVGVAKMILPSQVKVKVFDDIPYVPISSGSGIILTEDGYILTNAHVVDGAKRLAVVLYDGSEHEAEIIGIDKKSDLAVISIDGQGFVPAEMGTSANLVIGEEVALAGAGGGFENTVTYGHITGLAREIDTDYMSSSTIQCIQSDAALNPGNSGGALVNMYGQVVGVPVALMNHETYENIGFSIAVDDAVPIAEELIAYGYVTSRTRVGITYASIGDAAANGYGIMSGLCVMSVDPASGAAQAGLEPYDIITAMDGVRTFGAEEIAEVLKDKRPGDTVTLTVFRKSVTEEIEIFDTTIVLSADTSSISGYSVNTDEDSFFERDIIK